MIFDWLNVQRSEEMYFVLDERKLKEQQGSWLPLLLHSTFIKMSLFVKERSMLDLKLLFLTLLDWFSVWRNHHFSSILDLLDFCNVRF